MMRFLPNTLKLCTRTFNVRYASTASQEYVKVSNNGGVREITLCHQSTRNSLSMAMMNALHKDLVKDPDDTELRCIVLSAEGKIWSAGHNLKELQANDSAYRNEVFQKITDIILDIQKLPVPVISKVNGMAAAAGCQLVASCDIIVASDKSTFSTPGASVGVFCNTPGVAIGRVMSRPKSAYMLMTGLPITSQEAYVAGLVTKVVAEKDLDHTIDEITRAIKSKSRAVISLGKQFYYEQLNLPLKDAYKCGQSKMMENLELDDCKEGLTSFIEKRHPVWKHKA
ncbi:enoyl-CoA hydratase domain-containing protein 3, mitochondrial isoform X1 [Drosophila albomicans]|uniref:Enoyl-CoA hydratase domain-containing protein 3, mitochondrial n=2 Tax=Drosophila albomicans TaxID=7291 RepID=A0A6P8X109_DROAB|nr:enoyl-CoA hydratase domain-containing protein 3, mitochondrial isoform X1 [Drosophila albomicans]